MMKQLKMEMRKVVNGGVKYIIARESKASIMKITSIDTNKVVFLFYGHAI